MQTPMEEKETRSIGVQAPADDLQKPTVECVDVHAGRDHQPSPVQMHSILAALRSPSQLVHCESVQRPRNPSPPPKFASAESVRPMRGPPPELAAAARDATPRSEPPPLNDLDATLEHLCLQRYVAQVSVRACRKREAIDSCHASEVHASDVSTMPDEEGTPCRGGCSEAEKGSPAAWLLDDALLELQPIAGAGPPRVLAPCSTPCAPSDRAAAGEDLDEANRVLNERTQWRPPPISHEHVHRAFGLGARILAAHKASVDGRLSSLVQQSETVLRA